MSLYNVFFDLTRLEMHLWDRIDDVLRREIEVPLGRFEAMLILRRLGPCRIFDVARELSLTVGGTSKLIDRLEVSGLCIRTPHPDDRRSSLITLTENAESVLERGEAVIESALQATLGARLTADEVRTFGSQLSKLRRATMPPASP